MDKTDYAIVRELQKDGRLTNQELSERISLSPSPCLRRVKALQESGIIKGYAAIIDQKKYGLPITVFIRMKLDHNSGENVERFETAVSRLGEVLECHMMTGGADYMLRVLVASLDEYEEFMRRRIHVIEGIASIDTSFVIGEVKQSQVFKAV